MHRIRNEAAVVLCSNCLASTRLLKASAFLGTNSGVVSDKWDELFMTFVHNDG